MVPKVGDVAEFNVWHHWITHNDGAKHKAPNRHLGWIQEIKNTKVLIRTDLGSLYTRRIKEIKVYVRVLTEDIQKTITE
jgi:hypothetical protein